MEHYIQIADGFILSQQQQRLPLQEAAAILSTRKQHYYAGALREGDRAILIKHRIICPHCGVRQTASRHYLFGERMERISRRDINAWACDPAQLALWDDGLLKLYEPFIPKQWKCPSCGEVLPPEGHRTAVELTILETKLFLHCRGRYRDRDICEALEINLRKGRIIFTQYASGKVIRDITTAPSWFRDSYIYMLLSKHVLIRKKVYRAIRDYWGHPLPYVLKGLRVEQFFQMIRFIGYERSFYEAIPWCSGAGLTVHPHFSKMAKKLHYAKNAKVLLKGMELSSFRSVHRLFSRQPQLLFYHREVAVLFEVLGRDPKTFCSLLRGKHGFYLLSQLSAYPGIQSFLRDYTAVMGVAALRKQLDHSAGVVRFYALEYHAMDAPRKTLEQRTWKSGSPIQFQPGPGFSTPVRVGQIYRDGQVGEYHFRFLRSAHDFETCAKALDNPLLALHPEGNVAAICHGNGELLGAVQLYGRRVVHTDGAKSQPLIGQSRTALEQWCKENRFVLYDETDSDEFYCF